jgi:hypothetical protein
MFHGTMSLVNCEQSRLGRVLPDENAYFERQMGKGMERRHYMSVLQVVVEDGVTCVEAEDGVCRAAAGHAVSWG